MNATMSEEAKRLLKDPRFSTLIVNAILAHEKKVTLPDGRVIFLTMVGK